MLHFNLYNNKMLAGCFASLAALICDNLLPLFITVLIFEMMDFGTGVLKSAVLARRAGRRFAFESVKAWRTIYKLIFILVGVVLAEMLDKTIAEETRLRFANWFTAFCCGVEFWSFLENAAVISDHPLFRWLRKFMKEKVEETTGIDFDATQNQANANGQAE